VGLFRKKVPKMHTLPLTYFATGEPQITKTELGLKVSQPVSVNDNDGGRVGDYSLEFSYPAGKTGVDLQTAVVDAAKAAGKALLVSLEENLATKATVEGVASQISG
jgi:hypothetical protein